jgi:putative ABC transport system permease protein
MKQLRRAAAKVAGLFRNKCVEADLSREIAAHLALMEDELRAQGMTAEEAYMAARRTYGGVEQAKQMHRDERSILWLEQLGQDIRYALRSLAKSPGFTTVALLSLMLGIGASVALFSVVYGVLIAPYPYAKPNEIWSPAILGPHDAAGGLHNWHMYTRREFLEIGKLPAFSDVMATAPEPDLLTDADGGTESYYGVGLTGGAFNFIGVAPLLGRTIQPYDIHAGGEPNPVVVLTYGFWRRYFNGDAKALGAKLILNGVPHTVIGVMPPRFGWWTQDSFWLPMNMDLTNESGISVVMRLRPGVSKDAAEQQMNQLNEQLAVLNPQSYPKGKMRALLMNYMDITAAAGAMQQSLNLLLAAVGLLLLIACVNVANLQLARMTTRAREMAMRVAIGAGRGRLIRQLLTESVMLSLVGGVLGILFSLAATRMIVALIPPDNIPGEARITTNIYVLLFALGVSMLTGILFGLAPALRSSRPDLAGVMKEGGSGSGGSARGQAMRGGLVVTEIALSVILLTGASLAIRHFVEVMNTDPGFQPDKTLTLPLNLPPGSYPTLQQRNAFDEELTASVRDLPGVEAVAIGNGGMPYSGRDSTFSVEGRPRVNGQTVTMTLISSNYPRTLGIPVKRGREFTEEEVKDGRQVALINESAAKYWPLGENPVGETMQVDVLATPFRPPTMVAPGISTTVTIVGIIGDTRNGGLENAALPAVYIPYTLIAPPMRQMAIRTYGDPMAIMNAVRQKVRAMDPAIALGKPMTLEEMMGEEAAQPRFNMALFGGFALLGLALAAIGIYCVISYNVTQKVHEIGVRMALGASRGNILRWVLSSALKIAATGLLIGLAGSFVAQRVMRSYLSGQKSFDVGSLAGVVLVLSAVALMAAWLPAYRAGRLDPMTALRHDA